MLRLIPQALDFGARFAVHYFFIPSAACAQGTPAFLAEGEVKSVSRDSPM
jgi:hypothetical protein